MRFIYFDAALHPVLQFHVHIKYSVPGMITTYQNIYNTTTTSSHQLFGKNIIIYAKLLGSFRTILISSIFTRFTISMFIHLTKLDGHNMIQIHKLII
jgi:hypothetical protein